MSAGFLSRHSNLKFWSQPVFFLSVMWWCYAIASCEKVLKPIISGVDLQWAVSSAVRWTLQLSRVAADLASILHPPSLTPPSSTPSSDLSWLWQSIWMFQQGIGFYSSYKPANKIFNCIVCLIVVFVWLLRELCSQRELSWVALIMLYRVEVTVVTLWGGVNGANSWKGIWQWKKACGCKSIKHIHQP